MTLPSALLTERLLLRSWRPNDATTLHSILVANTSRLRPWIPPHVAEPSTIPELELRLAGFADAFDARREWRYAIFATEGLVPLGEVSVFPRASSGRVPLADADRVEIGYWLSAEAAGRGFATEAARAALDAASALEGLTRAEIRCDARNERSGAVPRRLGFLLSETVVEPALLGGAPTTVEVWSRLLGHSGPRSRSLLDDGERG